MSSQPRLDLRNWVERQAIRKVGDPDPLDWRLSPDCLAIRDVVNMYRFGVTERQAYHLSKCDSCVKWLDNYAKATSKAPAAVMQKSLFRALADFFSATQNQPLATPALLYIPNQVLEVCDPGESLGIEIAIWGGAVQKEKVQAGTLPEIDVKSLKLEGALIGAGATLGWQNMELISYPVVRFANARLGSVPRQGLGEHQELTEGIYLTGRFTGSSPANFIGHADVRLVKTSARTAAR